MIIEYVNQALRRAHYQIIDDGQFCGTVRGLRGVIATGSSLEACRDQLATVVQDWVLVRVAQGLRVPSLGGVSIEVKLKKAS